MMASPDLASLSFDDHGARRWRLHVHHKPRLCPCVGLGLVAVLDRRSPCVPPRDACIFYPAQALRQESPCRGGMVGSSPSRGGGGPTGWSIFCHPSVSIP